VIPGVHPLALPALLLACSDNARLASCGAERSILLWDVVSGRVIRRFRGHENEVPFNLQPSFCNPLASVHSSPRTHCVFCAFLVGSLLILCLACWLPMHIVPCLLAPIFVFYLSGLPTTDTGCLKSPAPHLSPCFLPCPLLSPSPSRPFARAPLVCLGRAQVNAVRFNHTDAALVSGGYDRSVKIWDCRSNSMDAMQVCNTYFTVLYCAVLSFTVLYVLYCTVHHGLGPPPRSFPEAS